MVEMKNIIETAFKKAHNTIKINNTRNVSVEKIIEQGRFSEIKDQIKSYNVSEEEISMYVNNDNELIISFEIEEIKTEAEKIKEFIYYFNKRVYRFMYNEMIENGYKRVGFNSALLKPFDNINLYELYIHNDFETLEKYYSLYFVK
jgi:hypothetical protein